MMKLFPKRDPARIPRMLDKLRVLGQMIDNCSSLSSCREDTVMEVGTEDLRDFTKKERTTFVFRLVLEGVSEITAEMANSLFESGCGDATLSSRGGVVSLIFDREAADLKTALFSAIEDVERSTSGLKVAEVLPAENQSEVFDAKLHQGTPPVVAISPKATSRPGKKEDRHG